MKRPIVLVASAAMVSIVAFASCKRGEETTAADMPVASASAEARPASVLSIDPELLESRRIVVQPALKRALSDQVAASGTVVPSVDGEAKVGALVSGRIASILVREGDRVKKGQILAWMDAPEAARMQGDYLRARARLWRADLAAERERKLWETNATSERELREAEAEVRASRAELEAARSMLATARVPAPKDDATAGMSRISITSPIEGVVAERWAVVGGYYDPQSALFDIVDPGRLSVRADVPEVAVRRLHTGAAARVVPRGSTAQCNARVSARLERIDPAKRTMGVMLAVDPPCDGLSPGGFADVAVDLDHAGGAAQIVVPRGAVVDLDGTPSLFVQVGPTHGGRFEVRSVRTGFSDGADVVIEEGVREGEGVVVEGAFLLKGEALRAGEGGE